MAVAVLVLAVVVTACQSPMDELARLDPSRAREIRVTCAGLEYPVVGESLTLASREDCETTYATVARTQAALDALQQRVHRLQDGDQPAES